MSEDNIWSDGNLSIRPSGNGSAAVLDAEGPAYVVPHKVPEVCQAIYAAAGLPVPDLPEVLDEAQVATLAADIMEHSNPGAMGSDSAKPLARYLLLAGYRKQGGER